MSGSSSLRHLLNPEPHTRHPPPQPHEDNPTYQPRHPSLSTTNFDSDPDPDDFFLLEDSEDEEEEPADMAPSTRNTSRRESVIDLTETPVTQSASRRRKRSTDEGPAPKRNRRTRRPVEEIDLVDENPSAEEELRQAQQQATIRAQQAEVDAGPQKLGKLQCIICMESYTNATATACGHFYCHECLHQSLLVGERADERKGTCPVCRKFISRKRKLDIIPMSFMKKSTFLKQKGKA